MTKRKGPILSENGWWLTGPFVQIAAVSGAYGPGQLYALDRDGQVWVYGDHKWSKVSHIRADSPVPLPPKVIKVDDAAGSARVADGSKGD